MIDADQHRQITAMGGSLEIGQGLVVGFNRAGAKIGEVQIVEGDAEQMVEALVLIAEVCNGVGAIVSSEFTFTELSCADGGRIEVDMGEGPEDTAVCIVAPRDDFTEEREVVRWTGKEWADDKGACAATLNAIVQALSEGAVAVEEMSNQGREL